MIELVKHISPEHPFTLADVGAMGGIAGKWDVLEGNMKVIAFEADEREYAKLTSTDRVQYLNFLIHGKKEDLTFHISRESGKSSIFSPNLELLSRFPRVERFEVVDRVHCPADKVRSFDDLYQEGFVKDLDFLKLDTEGSELSILQGGGARMLPNVFGVQCEVEFIEKCQGQPLFRQVDEFMAAQGFVLMDLRRAFWKRNDFFDYVGKGQMVFGDVLYFKNVDAFQHSLAQVKDPVYAKSKIYKAVIVCMVYKIFDYAVSVVRMGLQQQWLSQEEFNAVFQAVKAHARRSGGVRFPGRRLAYKIASRLAELLKPKSYLGFSDGDRHIGNIRDI